MDIANYSSDSRAIIKAAKEIASSLRHSEIDLEHLLIAVIRHDDSDVESILNQLGKSRVFIESIAEEHLKEQPKRSMSKDSLTVSPAVQAVLAEAGDEKAKLYDPLVEPQHILIAIFDPKSKLSSYVREQTGITKEDIYRAIAESKSVQEIATATAQPSSSGEADTRRDIAGSLKYCIDMTNQAAAGEFDPMVGREKELQQVIQILLRRRKNSPVLVGGAGVGKSAIVEGFAKAVVDADVPKALAGVKVMSLDMGSLVAGAKYKGEFEERFKGLVGEVVKSGGKIVLFVDEMHTLVGAGNASGGMDAANLIKPALARGQLRLIGATTEEEYTKYIEKDKALERRFERVKIDKPGFDDAVRIVKGVIAKYEDHHKITFDPEAISGAVKYSRRYLSERNLPDIALDLVDEAASEFAVKEELGKVRIASMDGKIAELEKLMQSLEGKDPEQNADEYDRLKMMYEDFCRDVQTLSDFWGHRVEASSGGAA